MLCRMFRTYALVAGDVICSERLCVGPLGLTLATPAEGPVRIWSGALTRS